MYLFNVFLFVSLDLASMDYYPDPNPALHLVVYSANQKGRSEPIVLENIPINEAEKRTGTYKLLLIICRSIIRFSRPRNYESICMYKIIHL